MTARPNRTRAAWTALCLVAAVFVTGCASRTPARTTAAASRADVSELWVDPGNIRSRDLFHGAGGAALAPRASARYDVLKVDDKGFSAGYDVRDREGTEWSVKLGPEAQSEVAASRILWAIGYHQPPTYLLSDWQLSGPRPIPASPARFRREQPNEQVVSEWSWHDNPFVGTQPYRGLIVANVMLNNWDWKTSNNKVYEVTGGRARRIYVVRDVGASLGKTSFPAFLRWTPFRFMAQGSRNDVDDFEGQQFIRSRRGDEVTFDYRGVHTGLVDMLTIADVEWTCRLLARLSDRQWDDAFRAAGYDRAIRERFVTHMKMKVQQGLAAAKDPEFRAAASR
jgi:hypothetical protein